MTGKWGSIRVFISSTFKDMHAERDHLVRVVFPELKERAYAVRCHITDVDLRWGVTEKDAQDGKALDICLDEIDTCRPYFIGLLGSRYGFIPEQHSNSITAQEIYHGVLHTEIPRQVPDLRRILEGRPLTDEQRSCLVECYPWDPEKQKYILRDCVTEADLELIRSVFKSYSTYQKDRSFFFFRTERLTKELAGANPDDFFESNPDVQSRLKNLKAEIESSKLPCYEYDSLESFGRMVLETLWERIRMEGAVPAEEEIDPDAEDQEAFLAERTRRFVGRRKLLDDLDHFTESQEPRVLVIHGAGGCGKSALMARFSQELSAAHPDWWIITHFVGASASSTSIRETLQRFCTIISHRTGSTSVVPQDYKELLRLFPALLQKTDPKKRIVFLIDAVNQLEKSFRSHSMNWLPAILPDNVRFVISTLPGETLDALRQRKDNLTEAHVRGLIEVEIRQLVGSYMEEIRHKFPNAEVEKRFFEKIQAGNPLYINVALEELRIFGRFEGLDSRVERLPANNVEMFDQVLERVEADFGKDLVQDCFSYLVCGRHGMTGEELQSLLKNYGPRDIKGNTQKLPDMIWTRLYRSMVNYLVERSGVIDCFHNDFRNAIETRYIRHADSAARNHTILGDYFERRWREPYIRSLNELPYQRTKSMDENGLKTILGDLSFVEAKCVAGMTYDLMEDYERAIESFPEVDLFQDFGRLIRSDSHILARYPELVFQQAANCFDDAAPAVVSARMISSGEEKRPWWRWINKEKRETSQVMTLTGHTSSVYSCAFSTDGKRIASAGWDGIRIWDSGTGEQYDPHPVTRERASYLCFTDAGLWMVRKDTHGALQADLLEEQTWRILNHWLLPATDVHSRIAISPDNRFLALVAGSEITIFDPITHHEIQRLAVGGGSHASLCCGSFSQDGKIFAAIDPIGDIHVWNTQSWEKIVERRSEAVDLRTCSLSPDGGIIALTRPEGTLCEELTTGKTLAVFRGHSGAVEGCCFSPDGKQLLTCARDNSILVWTTPKSDGDAISLPEEFKDFTSKKSGFQTTKWTSTFFPSCAISPDGAFSVLTDAGAGIFILNDTGKERIKKIATLYTDLSRQGGAPGTFAFSSDLRLAAGGCMNGEIELYDLEKDGSGHRIALKEQHEYRITGCSFSPNDSLLLTVSEDRTFHLYQHRSRKLIRAKQAHDGIIHGCTFLADGSTFLTVSVDRTIKIWKTQTGELIDTLNANAGLLCCSISTDQNSLLTGGSDGSLGIWNLKERQLLRTFTAHKEPVRSCWWSKNAGYIVAAHADGTIIALDSNSGERLSMFLAESDLLSSSFAPNVSRALLTTRDNSVYLLSLENLKEGR